MDDTYRPAEEPLGPDEPDFNHNVAQGDNPRADEWAELRRALIGWKERIAEHGPPRPTRMGSFAEDFPERRLAMSEHTLQLMERAWIQRHGGEETDLSDLYDVEVTVSVIHPDGTDEVEVWQGISDEHAFSRAFIYHLNTAKVIRVSDKERWGL